MEYMEHSNFYAMCDKIRKQEARELHSALNAHGGEFTWIDDDNDEEQLYNPPIIMANLNSGPTDIVIHKAWLDDDCIELLGFDNELDEQIEFELEDIAPGHLAYLIGHMPITDKVKSVATVEKLIEPQNCIEMKKLSELLEEKQAIAKAEIINVIKNALPQDGSKMEFGLDKWPLSIGYNISCECFDDLDFLYIKNHSVLASFCQEPDNEVELECFHESSLINIVDYLERHGFISQNKVEKMK